MATPNIEEILASLQNEVLFGKAYLTLVKGLVAADPVVMQTAPTFFGLTHEASLQTSQILAAKLYDTTKGAITVDSLLSAATNEAGSFKNGNKQQIASAISGAKQRIAKLQPTLRSIKTRRNKALAHLDPQTVIDPKALATTAKLTIPELEKVFDETGHIVNEISSLYNGVMSSFDLVDGTDYQMALGLIAKAKTAEADKYEKEFKQPWPYKRPRSC